ncbi:MAG: L-2-amino-thiazoline-4-carboxylic acid hydrolase [Azospirillaceae bacterium]|nr:L-2-amino-thiazoline-4-carboxylic acid hydrolase [Azospirillaceae bacterium]
MTESILERRRIEAEFAKGLFETLSAELGVDRARAILTKAIIKMAQQAGRSAAAVQEGPPDLADFAALLRFWTMNDALEIDFLVREPQQLDFNVTRCRYAEIYREIGVGELGAVLSCNRDGAFCEGYNPAIALTRTQTIMGGASHCDFRYRLPAGGATDPIPGDPSAV